jgi:hypothetical protein
VISGGCAGPADITPAGSYLVTKEEADDVGGEFGGKNPADFSIRSKSNGQRKDTI